MHALAQTVTSVPWQRLTTAYGRGTDIPRLLETGQYKELANLIEHQGTLWQTTPWALLMLLPFRSCWHCLSRKVRVYRGIQFQ
ncbi:hypothetical protein PAEVO_61750 [Paenibacillus sp. GM2FR]|nr:hypothetical protein [Yersinia pestis]PJN49466.1 hypothetical protein PAEVO_61750 [Paenibacillus sp. GM2FR]